MAEHNEKGKFGEELAIKFLQKSGYTILHTNWRYNRREIDVIARKDSIIAIVEVKLRSTDYYGRPEEFVNKRKQKLLIEAAEEFMQTVDENLEIRFDIIAIVKTKSIERITHIEEAFEPFLD